MNKLDQYIQDALDLVEFANGPVTSTWGKRRADLGHPAPFGMKTARRRQRAVGAGLSPALRGVPEGAQGEIPGGPACRERRSVHRSPGGEGAIGGAAQDARRPHRRALLPHAGLVLRARLAATTPTRGPARRSSSASTRRTRRRSAADESRNVLAGGAGRSGVPDWPRAECGRGAHVRLRAALRAHRRVAVDAEPDLVRQPALVRDAELLRAAAVRREPRRDRAADHARREACDGQDGLFASAAIARRQSRIPWSRW